MKIAVEGCCHGELDKIYETIAYLEQTNNVKVDILLICGDFQSVRNASDLQCMAVPPKYRLMNTFYKYYSGEKKAPVLTIFIGGNHEASNYLQELPHGGWVAPNIYYMGYANVVQFGGVRIGGLSGIFKPRDYDRGHFERPPYSEDTKRSAYHIRNFDVFRLKQISRPMDIMLSHDWPRGIYHHGNKERLLRAKRHFREEVESNSLGSWPAEELLHHMKPNYWFSAHLHVKFAAAVQHQMPDGSSKTTKFLSLDKCLPKRQFLQILDIPHDASKELSLELDPEWLVILKSTNHLFNIRQNKQFMPGLGCSERWDFRPTDEEIASIKTDFDNNLAIPDNFVKTVPAYTPTGKKQPAPPPVININPQTTLLCTMLDLTDPNAQFLGRESSFRLDSSSLSNMSDSLVDDGIQSDDGCESVNSSINTTMNSSINPDEIAIDDDDDDDLVTGELISDSDIQPTTTSDEKDLSPFGADSDEKIVENNVDGCLTKGEGCLTESEGLLNKGEGCLTGFDGCLTKVEGCSTRDIGDKGVIETQEKCDNSEKVGILKDAISENIGMSSDVNNTRGLQKDSTDAFSKDKEEKDDSNVNVDEDTQNLIDDDDDDELKDILAAQNESQGKMRQSGMKDTENCNLNIKCVTDHDTSKANMDDLKYSKNVDCDITNEDKFSLKDQLNPDKSEEPSSNLGIIEQKGGEAQKPKISVAMRIGESGASGAISPKRELEGQSVGVNKVKKMSRRNICVYSSEDTEGEG